MTPIIPIRRTNPAAADDFLSDIAAPERKFSRKRFRQDLPDILQTALALILKDLDVAPGQATSGAVGCRLLAYCVARLKD